MFSAALNASSLITARVAPKSNLTTWMKSMSTNIDRAVDDYAIVSDGRGGKVYAYELDGYGSHILMDDPNIPSLLSAPYIGYTTARDPIYQATRNKILSRDNPYYSKGGVISGVTSQHTLPGNVWPMGNIMTILTSEDEEEMREQLAMVVRSTGGLGLVHESVGVDGEAGGIDGMGTGNGGRYTRAWFSWANGLLGQAVLRVEERAGWVLGGSFQ